MVDREFFLGFIKIHILYHASKEPIFGAEIAGELASHGYGIGPGTLYPALHRLEEQGYLESNTKVVKGRVRKYYRTTQLGESVLKQSKERIKELVSEVIGGEQLAESQNPGDKKVWGLNPNVFFLGIVSFLTDVSSEMIFTLVPLFLANVLGAGMTVIGLVGGLSESTDAIFKILSGWLSDRVGRRKPLAVAGYGLSTVMKPFMYFAASWGAVLAIRFTDRVGKGLRGSPRDALIADSVSIAERGRSFGIHRAMDTAGAALGLGIAAVITYLVQGENLSLSLTAYRWLVLVGTIPAVLGVLVLLIFVKERKKEKSPPGASSIHPAGTGSLTSGFSRRFKLFLLVMAIFTLGKSSDFFIILRAQDLGVPVLNVILALIALNIVYAAISTPAGQLSDRLGRKRVIALGWLVYGLVYLGFARATEVWQVLLLFAGFGVYYGIVEGVARAFVADLVPSEKRGTAYGLYHGVVGVILLPASVIGGWLWQAVNPSATFYFGAGLALLAVIGIVTLVRE